MTRDEILKLEAGRELDALVAEKVMGLLVTNHGTAKIIYGKVEVDGKEHVTFSPVRPYSTDIAAAWEVVEKMSDDYEITINATHRKYWCHASGPTWKQLSMVVIISIYQPLMYPI